MKEGLRREKAADRGAAGFGIVTTCAPDGEGKWCGEFTNPTIGKLIRLIVDRDDKGENHGKVVAGAIAPHVREVKIIHLPSLPPKGDLWDWIEAGGTREQLKNIVEKTPAFVTSPEPSSPPAGLPQKVAEVELPETSLLKQMRNDTGNADRLIVKYGGDLRYCPAFRKWLVWEAGAGPWTTRAPRAVWREGRCWHI